MVIYIQTVLGIIHPNELGICACHEHLYIDLSHIKNDKDTCLTDLNLVKVDLSHFVKLGGKAIVELTNDGMGRNVDKLVQISKELDVHIIASTGCYKYPFIPEEKLTWTRDQFSKWMITEIKTGINGTNIKPGVIGEIGSSLNEFKKIEIELFHGAIQAAKATMLPLSTHTSLGTMAIEQIEMCIREGIALDQVIIGHQDLNRQDEVIIDILSSGAYIAFDTIGKESYRSDHERLDLLLKCISYGYEDQVLLSADVTRQSHLRINQGQGYDVVLRKFVPMLRQHGITQEIIEKLLINNPQKAFSIRREHSE